MNIGTIGTGQIVSAILRGVAATPGASCGAVYSRERTRGEKLAGEFGVARVYTELEDLLADESLDWIYIASPNSLHHPQARAALLAGKNVLLEKPFTSTARQAQELIELAEQRNLLLLEAVTTEFLPHYARLRELLPELGRLRLVLCNYSQFSSRYEKLLAGERTNAFDPAFCGGALMDINYYNIRLMVSLFGAPEAVQYYPNLHSGIDTSGIAVLRYADFLAQCTGAKDTWGDCYVQLEGEGGHLYAQGGANELLSLRLTTNARTLEVSEQPEGGLGRWQREIEGLVQRLQADDRDFFRRQLAISLAAVQTTERLRKSAGLRFPGDDE